MKRLTAILLSVLFLLTALPLGAVSVAADSSSLQEGVINNVEVDEQAWVYFTPAVTGVYNFYSLADGDTYGTLYNSMGDQLASNDDGGSDTNFAIEYVCFAGETYELQVRFYSHGSGTIPVCVEQVVMPTLQEDVLTDAELAEGTEQKYLFIPEQTGYYEFYSLSGQDTYGTIYDTYGNIKENDDGGEENNFLIRHFMVAGEIYFLSVRFYDYSSGLIPLVIRYEGMEALLSGVLTNVEITEEYTELSFTPEESGHYAFYSSSSMDTYGQIYDANFNELASNDDSGEGNNFRISYYMTAGETYILRVRFYSYSTGTIPVMIEKHNPKVITDIEFLDQSMLVYEIENNYAPSMVITYSDGSQRNYNTNWPSDDTGEYYVERSIVGNPVDPIEGMTYTVNATVELSDRTITGSYQLTVLECPIASVSVQPITVVENTGGYWRTQSYWDDEDQYHEVKYYHYENIYPDWSTTRITLKDGTVIEGTDVYFNDDWYSINIDDQGPEQYLTLGTHQWRLSLMGYETTYTINVIESPIASAGGTTVESLQYEGGYWEYHYVVDPDTQMGQDAFFYVYDTLPDELVLTMKDGTQQRVPVVDNPNEWYGGRGIVYNGQWYEIEFNSDQTYENPWQVGTYIATATVMNVDISYYYVVQRRPNDLLLEYEETSEGIVITGCVYPFEELEIPATLFGKPIIGMTGLGQGGFGIRRLVLPDSVRYIGEYLLNYSNVESVHFGAGVENLTSQHFSGAYNLQEITISPYNPYYTVQDGVLYDKDVATLIAYPEARDAEEYVVPMTLYDALPLTECYRSVNVVIPEDHPYMATIDGVTYDKGVTRVLYCNEEVGGEYEMPASVTEMADYAFADTALTRVVVAPRVTEIAYQAFASCAMLEEISLPEGLISIVDRGLAYTSSLESVVLPSTVTYLDNMAFDGSGIRSITLPVGLEFIGDYAFDMCYNLTDVYYTGSEADRAAMYIGYDNDLLLNATWHYNACPKGGEHSYDNGCDASCNACGYVRGDTTGHEYSSPCAAACDNCGTTRVPPHGYADACDSSCDLCGETRTPPHDYDNGYDDACNLCGFTRDVPDVAPGDTNGDGKINVRDLGVLQQHLNGWDVDVDPAAADTNGDGKINVRDLGVLQQYLNGWDVQLGS